MILTHFKYVPVDVDWHSVVDDFGNLVKPFADLSRRSNAAWWNAYRFANGQSFEQAGMRTIGCLIEEH